MPIRKNGCAWKEDCAAARARNEALRATKRFGRALRKRWTGYHARSRIETKMQCLNAFGERIASRDPDRQIAEIHARIAPMNRFTALGRAEIVRVAEPKGEWVSSAPTRVAQQRRAILVLKIDTQVRRSPRPSNPSDWAPIMLPARLGLVPATVCGGVFDQGASPALSKR